MPLTYAFTAVPDTDIPRAAEPLLQHALDTYASETNKVVSVWRELRDDDLGYRPHPKATSIGDILKHQLLSERRFFGEFLGSAEPAPADVVPSSLWRRVLHTAHHRTQITVYLRTMGRAVPSTYGPTADVKWTGADPTTSVAAAGRQ